MSSLYTKVELYLIDSTQTYSDPQLFYDYVHTSVPVKEDIIMIDGNQYVVFARGWQLTDENNKELEMPICSLQIVTTETWMVDNV